MKVPPPHSRTPAFLLFGLAGICALAGLGLAFTIYGEVALLAGVLTAVAGALVLWRSSDPHGRMAFRSPPGWPAPPADFRPTPGWNPDPSWPDAPTDWQFWVRQRQAYRPAPVPFRR